MGAQCGSLVGAQEDYSPFDLDLIRSICASIEASFRKCDTHPKSVTRRSVPIEADSKTDGRPCCPGTSHPTRPARSFVKRRGD